MKTKRHKRIFASMVKYYMLSVILILLVVLVIGLGVMYFIAQGMEAGRGPQVVASSVVREDYENIDIQDISIIGGWVEILDEDLGVIYIKGDKKDIQMQYSRDDVMNLLDITKGDHDIYHGTIEVFQRDEMTYYCMVKVPIDNVKVMYSYQNIPYEFLDTMFTPLIIGLILIIIAFIVNTFVYGWWMSKKIMRPLRGLATGIETITGGHYDMRLDFNAEKEFVIIRDAMNDMAETLEQTWQDKIRLEESRMRLLTDISHDIKTPMSTIQGYIKALKDGMIADEQKEVCYETIYRKALRVDELMNDMFDYVKLEHVDYKVHLKLQNFTEFCRELIAEYYQQMEDKNFQVELLIPDNMIMLSYDSKLINRAIANLLDNMIKYNPVGTKARIELYQDEEHVYLEIADGGIGIPEEVRNHLFDPFVRGDGARRSDGGSGLGLAITRHIIQKHGGHIHVSDGRTKESTMFTITLCREQ